MLDRDQSRRRLNCDVSIGLIRLTGTNRPAKADWDNKPLPKTPREVKSSLPRHVESPGSSTKKPNKHR